jgi:glycosyltransferase involved in cell wall biosynthesis
VPEVQKPAHRTEEIEESMHIFITIASIDPAAGGPSRSVPNLARQLAHQGIAVRLKSIGNSAVNAGNNGYALELYPHAGTVFSKLKAIGRMRRDLMLQVREHADGAIIHDQGIWLLNNHAAAGVAIKTGTPLIVSTRGMLEPWAINHKAFKKKIAWHLYQKSDLDSVDLFHATSQQEARHIFESGFRKPVALVPNGVDIPLWRERTPSADGRKTILFLSRIYPVKGLLNLVSAWQSIRDPDWRIVVAGPDEAGHKKEVMTAVHAAGLQDCFDFVGSVDDDAKWDRFFNADLFVLPSFTENFGIAVAEALACGVPVITTIGTPWQELISHRCGWWVDIGVAPLVDALREAIALPDSERSVMGLRGRQLVENGYSWAKVGKDMAEVYSWVLGSGPKPEHVLSS